MSYYWAFFRSNNYFKVVEGDGIIIKVDCSYIVGVIRQVEGWVFACDAESCVSSTMLKLWDVARMGGQ